MTNYESMLVAALLDSPELLDTVPIESKAFGDARYRTLYEVLSSLKGGVVSPATVCQELENRGWKNTEAVKLVSTLVGLYPEHPEFEVVQSHASAVNEGYQRRGLASTLTALLRDLKDGSISYADILSKLGQSSIEAQTGIVERRDPTGHGIIDRLLDKMQRGIAPSFPSGLRLVDDCLASKGLKAGNIWFVVGAYKAYKTRLVMHMCHSALAQGKSVSYIGLESDDITFSTALMASKFGIAERAFENYYSGQFTPSAPQISSATYWLDEQKWRVYDRKHGVGDWKRIPAILMADKMKYGTDLVIVDHVQKWSKKYEVLGDVDNMLTDVAQQAEVALVVLSQISNQNFREGSPDGQLPTKGSGDFGALVDVGLEISKDQKKSDFTAGQELIDAMTLAGTVHLLNPTKSVSELALQVKIARKGNTGKHYCIFDVFSGSLLLQSDYPRVLPE